jgi:hypothetical protein
MKNFTFNLFTAAATLIAATATASAQSHLIANVPFSFQVSAKTVLPAGDYKVMRVGGNANSWAFEDQATGKKNLVALGHTTASRRMDNAKLEFVCRAQHCGLIKIQTGYGETGYEIPAPKMRGAEEARLVEVPLTRSAE